jgi:predicted nicotinamide N-methyase
MEDVNPFSTPLIEYDMVSTVEKIGSFPIHLHSIRNMDQALDAICKKYEPKTPEEESQLLDLCPYFAQVWPSARGLALFLSERKKQFNKRQGIEVGCGLGLPAIVASQIGASMTATDFHPDVDYWLNKNAALNQTKISYLQWDWTDQNPGPGITFGKYDFVLASDVLYEKQHPEFLVRALSRLVKPGGSVYLSDPGRAYLDRALLEFKKLAFDSTEFYYEVEESSLIPEHRLEKRRSVRVFELNLRSLPF